MPADEADLSLVEYSPPAAIDGATYNPDARYDASITRIIDRFEAYSTGCNYRE